MADSTRDDAHDPTAAGGTDGGKPSSSRSRWTMRLLGAGVAVAVVATSWVAVRSTQEGDDPVTPAPQQLDGQAVSSQPARPQIRLAEGQPVMIAGDEVEVVDGIPLPQDRIDAVTGRLDPFAEEEGDRQAFSRPAESIPPPVAGETVATTFPPADAGDGPGAPETPTGPLEVLRVQPEGDVAIAPFLSLTFNQPMVSLATLDQLDAAEVPVTISPELPGRWRWIGTRTLRFDYDTEGGALAIDRLPMATEYTVTVPTGTSSASGTQLAEPFTFTFATPPPDVVSFRPLGESLSLDQVFVAEFDQLVDPEAVLAHITLDADGQRPVRLATADEVEADDAARQAASQSLDGRWVAFRPVDPLPADTRLSVTFGEGTRSAEGPRTRQTEKRHTGRTFPPLRIIGDDCGYGGRCRPGQPLSIQFSNPLDAAAFDPSIVRIAPELPGATIGVQFEQLLIQGPTQADTTYTVAIGGSLQDDRGQTLGEDATREFRVREQAPFLRQFHTDMVTVDPLAERPSVSMVSAGHEDFRVVAMSVTPEDWERYLELPRYEDDIEVPEFPVVFDRVVPTGAEDGVTVETLVDLTDAFPDGSGQTLLFIEPTRTFSRTSDEYYNNLPFLMWVQATHIGVDAFNDDDQLVVWTTDLRDGTPIAGAEVAHDGQRVTTDADGLATFALDSTGDAVITASADGQVGMLAGSYPERWQAQPMRDVTRWYVFDDRGLYRPGETIRLKGWVRRLTLSEDARIRPVGEGATVTYQVFDGQYNEVATGEATLNALGGFDLALDLPAGANLGHSSVAFQLSGTSGVEQTYFEHAFQIQEFRRPEFEVTAQAQSPGPHVLTRPVTTAATATYFSGGGLPNAPVTWTVRQQDTTYRPPGWEGFSFGVFIPWWQHGGGVDIYNPSAPLVDDICCFPGAEQTVERFDGVTDASGTHHLEVSFDAPEDGGVVDQPILVSANATVEDVNRQAFGATADLLVHAGERYLGLRSDRAFVRQGDPLRIDAILTDIDGDAAVGQPLTLTAERLVQNVVAGEWVEEAVDAQTCDVTTAAEAATCEFTTAVGGRYRVSSTVDDGDGGHNRTELEVWVSGGDAVPSRGVDQEQLTLIPARQEHVVGDTAEILVPSPFSPATGLVTITRNGIERTEVVAVTDGSAVIEVPLTDDMVPGIQVQVDLVGAAPRRLDDGSPATDLPARPAFATGSVSIAVPPTSRTLTVQASPRDEAVTPGDSTAVDVTVTDADGVPVNGADVAVVVVDEAILSLTGYDLIDPVTVFHSDVSSWLSTEYLRRTIQLSRADALTVEGLDAAVRASIGETGGDDEAAEDMAAEESADSDAMDGAGGTAAPMPAASALTAGSSAAGGGGGEPIDVRTNFDALAVFAPSITTDADGRVSVDVDLPDNLTRYRIMAVAAAGDDAFGKGESTITARLPLQVRPSAPRFANFGDAFELPVVLQNGTDEPLQADVVLETANLDVDGPSGTTQTGVEVTVPAGDRVEVRFPVTVSDAGTARFRATAVSGDVADSASVSLPVYTPTTSESFATYGVIDGGVIAQPMQTPTAVVPQFGGLEVTTSSTALQALTDAVLYLESYRYTSTDAFASRLLAISALRDVLDAFDAEELPEPAEIERVAAADIAGLVGLQNDDGGWPVWQRTRETEPYHTIQATHALLVARDAGYDVPGDTITRALDRLTTIEQTFDPELSVITRQTLRAYAVHVRHLAGDSDPARAREIYDALDDRRGDEDGADGGEGDLPLDVLAWLWPVLADGGDQAVVAQIERTFDNQVTETPSAATFVSSYGEDVHVTLGSDRRTDGIILDAFIDQRPGSDLIPKIVNGLIANQKQGRWDNVQENAFILLALKRYFDTFESATPDLVARVWLGDLYAAEHTYQGRSIDSTLTVVPTAELLQRDDPQIVVSAEGTGRLYYRLGLRTAPASLQLEARDEGFVVQREYEAVGDPSDVIRDADGTWRIRAGAEVRVTLTMVADSRRVNMALVDPLPAGLESVNPALAASPALPPDPEEPLDSEGDLGGIDVFHGYGWYGTWYDHQNLRDDRTEAFSAYLSAGTYTYSYIARATTPGTFIVPPTRAEEIYTPEVFGRTSTDRVVVEG